MQVKVGKARETFLTYFIHYGLLIWVNFNFRNVVPEKNTIIHNLTVSTKFLKLEIKALEKDA